MLDALITWYMKMLWKYWEKCRIYEVASLGEEIGLEPNFVTQTVSLYVIDGAEEGEDARGRQNHEEYFVRRKFAEVEN